MTTEELVNKQIEQLNNFMPDDKKLAPVWQLDDRAWVVEFKDESIIFFSGDITELYWQLEGAIMFAETVLDEE